jgi:hypothetical protein
MGGFEAWAQSMSLLTQVVCTPVCTSLVPAMPQHFVQQTNPPPDSKIPVYITWGGLVKVAGYT